MTFIVTHKLSKGSKRRTNLSVKGKVLLFKTKTAANKAVKILNKKIPGLGPRINNIFK